MINLLPGDTDLATLNTDTLQDQISLLSAHINAANSRLLELIGELDSREPWAAMGCKTCAHYLNWKCGIALGAAREKARAAKALRTLPRIRDAFRAGRISYSKVRALTRVATPENESELLVIAFGGTASHVENVVRHYRQMTAALNPANVNDMREFSAYFDDDGMLVFRGRLTAEQGAVLMQAIDAVCEAPPPNHQDDFRMCGADALARVAELALSARAGDAHTADRFQVRCSVPAQTLASNSLEDAPGDVFPALDVGPVLSLQTIRRLCCDGTVIPVVEDANGLPLNVGRKTRTVPPALRRALERRDGGCRFPGCTQTRHVDAHHIQHWAQGGETSLDNLVLLCRRHHTWLHEGGYSLERTDNAFQFRSPRGIVNEASEEKRFRGNLDAITDRQRQDGLTLDETTAECEWDGKPPDYDHILFALGQGVSLEQTQS